MSTGVAREPRRSTPAPSLRERRRRELRDVRYPPRPDLRIERVLVCPSGVHVVTTLYASAAPSAAALDPAQLASARATADLVAALLPERYRARVRTVVCLADGVPLAELVDDVLVTSPSTLEHIVGSSPAVLSTSEVHEVALRLDARTEPFPVTPVRERRRGRRRTVAAGVLAAVCAAAAALLALEIVTPPW